MAFCASAAAAFVRSLDAAAELSLALTVVPDNSDIVDSGIVEKETVTAHYTWHKTSLQILIRSLLALLIFSVVISVNVVYNF